LVLDDQTELSKLEKLLEEGMTVEEGLEELRATHNMGRGRRRKRVSSKFADLSDDEVIKSNFENIYIQM
jgi:hypothetical protein